MATVPAAVIGGTAVDVPAMLELHDAAPVETGVIVVAPPRLIGAPAIDAEDLPMPWSFELYLLVFHFVFMANCTVVLPTAYGFIACLGWSSWLAGLMIAVGIGAGVMTLPFGSGIMKHTYKPPLYAFAMLACAGNLVYGLGEVLRSPWVLIAGQVVKSVFWGSCGVSLSNHAIYTCVGKRKRAASTTLRGHMGYFGMCMGPLFGVVLSKISISVGLLHFDEYTNPGWLFGLVWLAMLVWLLLVPEPPRLFLDRPSSVAADVAILREVDELLDSTTLWGLSAVAITSAAVAVWEVSTAVLSQQFIAWSIMTCCLCDVHVRTDQRGRPTSFCEASSGSPRVAVLGSPCAARRPGQLQASAALERSTSSCATPTGSPCPV